MTIDISMVVVMITILLALFGVVFGYGVLTNKVNVHAKDIEKLETSYRNIDNKLDTICSKVAVIEEAVRKSG